MPNKNNLLPPFQSPEKAKGNLRDASVNGKKGAKKKKENATFAMRMKWLMQQPVTDERQINIIKSSGMPVPKKPTFRDFYIATTSMKSIKKGSLDEMIKLAGFLGEDFGTDEKQDDGVEVIIDV